MKRERLRVVKLSFLLVLLTIGSAIGQQANIEKTESNSGRVSLKREAKAEVNAGRKAWLKLLPKISECRQRRNSLFVEHVNEIRRIVRKSLDNASTEKFVDALMGLDGLFTAGTGQQEVEKLIERQFANHILNLDQLLTEIQKVYESYDTENRIITNNFLIACKLDLELDPRAVKACSVDTSSIRYQLSQQRDKIVNQFYTATKDQLVALGAGVAAGSIGHSLSHLGDDKNGPTVASTILGILGSVTAEMMAEEITLNALKTKSKLAKVTNDVVRSLVSSVTGKGNEFAGCDQGLLKMNYAHQSLLLSNIAAHVGVDLEFANKNLPK